ncbi:phytanoyl-CoA dioxygenase PhyH [Motilibacter peucedani]|uniref:Phytanoyl-CoA dioxygenase PhyH n=1 Tax=Motilibacter peucedani TaxID=598650 RepID=A0A420XNG7_9ACTN|nr:phytanoyl-CoA dioxygenase family protein [Motilibacter peucedani]RKS72799.1 phytanoyl-CoA dioxygenase PhyH [Motilibacter peucedani]
MTVTVIRETDELPVPPGADEEATEIVRAIYTEGITAKKGAFSREFAERMREDIDVAFEEARDRPGGAVGRGPKRWYVEIHPEQLRGFVEIVDHPWVRKVCESVLGADYRIVEVGFDIPFAGAVYQPWHRDYPMPELTRREGRLNSLHFNLTAVDTEEDMGPFEIAPGTQWDWSEDFGHQMFPPRPYYPRYDERAIRKYPMMGDISARTALTIHRGTKNYSQKSRPVLVIGVDSPGAGIAEKHDLAVTKAYWEQLPQSVRDHMVCPVVDELTPITQKHTIEGLVMGEAE